MMVQLNSNNVLLPATFSRQFEELEEVEEWRSIGCDEWLDELLDSLP